MNGDPEEAPSTDTELMTSPFVSSLSVADSDAMTFTSYDALQVKVLDSKSTFTVQSRWVTIASEGSDWEDISMILTFLTASASAVMASAGADTFAPISGGDIMASGMASDMPSDMGFTMPLSDITASSDMVEASSGADIVALISGAAGGGADIIDSDMGVAKQSKQSDDIFV